MSLRVGMVAGEPSGDLLAARVMHGIASRVAQSRCEGIGGPAMLEQGFDQWRPMHALTVFGYVDAFKRLPSLVGAYLGVKRRWLAQPPDVFVGVDAPDFNLRLELRLRRAGIPTVHFVGPSIWAWRYERIHTIRAAVSHILVLFPFEEALYQKEGIPVTFVGHPLAAAIPMRPDRAAVRAYLGIGPETRVLALLPGSRSSEIKLIAPRFLQAAQHLQKRDPALHVLTPMVNAQRRAEFQALLKQFPINNCHILDQAGGLGGSDSVEPGRANSRSTQSLEGAAKYDVSAAAYDHRPVAWNAMEAADAVLAASGTATLEAALFKRPMVISYVISPAMKRIMQWRSGQSSPTAPWVGLPNVLLNDFVVPELLQDDATPDALADAVWLALTDTSKAVELEGRFTQLHKSLSRDTPTLAAKAIIEQAQHGAS